MAGELPDAPWVTKDLPDAPWAAPAQQPAEPEPVPPSFLHRLATGMMIGGAADASPEELRQKGFEDFNYPANVAQQFKAGLDRARKGLDQSQPEAGQEFHNPAVDIGLGAFQALTSPLSAAFQLAGGMGEKASGGLLPSEAVQDALMLSDGAQARISRIRNGVEQVIGELPNEGDFQNAAGAISPKVRLTSQERGIVEQNLHDLWQERGIHPAEAAHDAQRDTFMRNDLTAKNLEPPDRSDIPPVQGTPIPTGTPRSMAAMTGEDHIDRILQSEPTKQVIDSPVVDREHTVPYTAGGSVPLEDPTFFVDSRFPRSFTIDGVTFDPADPFAIHENLEQHTMELLTKGGMDAPTAYKVAHFEFAEKAEGAWYAAHGIDQTKAEAAYAPYMAEIQKSADANPPPNLYKRPYPHDDPSAARNEPIAEPKPTAAEIRQAKAILDSQDAGGVPRGLGADAALDTPDLASEPLRPRASLMTGAKAAADKLLDMGRDFRMWVAPMAAGSRDSMAIAKDFANAMRRNRWEWNRVDADIAKRFTPEQRKRMWDAADEESVARQLGESREHQGLVTLEPAERAAVEELQARSQLAWARVRDMGMVEGEGLPAYTPRMVINAASAVEGDKAIPLNGLGSNLRTRTAQMMRRKYMTAEETEAAAKARLGDDATIARDIRALPLATARLEDAIAGRTLIDNIKNIGRQTGAETVADGFRPDSSWFTLDHPAFRTYRPRMEEVDGVMRAAKDQDGNTIFDQVPLYVRGDFEGPLRAVLNVRKGAQSYSGSLYGAAMAIKGKTMGLIMNSPLIHNAVEWGRALPAMPGKVASFKVYFEGNRAKNDFATMKEAIDGGLVPIGHRFFNQDINSIMEEPNLTPGRSWTSQVLGFVPGLFDEGAGNAVKAAIDKAGDFWHNTLLWDRVADLQMGLYTNFRDDLLAKGVDGQTAARAAAHWANRYAGALPKEAMSDAATKVSNMLLFSRTFTMGNLGVLKDMLTGLPKDVMAQIERDAGFGAGSIAGALPEEATIAVQYAKTMARRKAMSVVALDMALFYVGNSVLQSALNVMKGDHTLDEEMHGYATRLSAALEKRAEHPLALLQPFDFIQSLSSTSENEPGKEGRIKIGHAADGTAIYARNPAGKIGEEFLGYMTGPLDMMRRKQGTIARPAFQIMANDAGFGRKIYDPDADTPAKYLRNLGNIAAHIAGSQLPEGQIGSFSDLVKGQGDPKVNAAQAFGPVASVTFAKGAPGGEAVGELYHARTEHNYAVDAELPDIRRQIQRGDEQGARDRMIQLGIPRGLQNFYVRTSQNPATRLSPRTLRDFYQYATPEQKARMENAR
jgi:hypothetical protein